MEAAFWSAVRVTFAGDHATDPMLARVTSDLGIPVNILAGAVVMLGIAIGQKFGYFGQPEGLNLNRNVTERRGSDIPHAVGDHR